MGTESPGDSRFARPHLGRLDVNQPWTQELLGRLKAGGSVAWCAHRTRKICERELSVGRQSVRPRAMKSKPVQKMGLEAYAILR